MGHNLQVSRVTHSSVRFLSVKILRRVNDLPQQIITKSPALNKCPTNDLHHTRIIVTAPLLLHSGKYWIIYRNMNTDSLSVVGWPMSIAHGSPLCIIARPPCIPHLCLYLYELERRGSRDSFSGFVCGHNCIAQHLNKYTTLALLAIIQLVQPTSTISG